MNQRVLTSSAAATTGNRAKVFVSYSRKDMAFAQMLVGALVERGFDSFLDKTDIAPGEPWKERLAGLIAAADTVVFAVSPDSVASSICAWELEESVTLNKRLLPVVTRRIADTDAPPLLSRLNWIFCTEDDDKDAALTALDAALHTDLTWVREHTRLGELARRWADDGRRNSETLRATGLEAAERWLDSRPADANAPTDLHQDFIRASRRAATTRQRYWVGGAFAVAAAAITLAGFAEVSRREAQTQRERAEHTLTLATDTANSLVFDLTQKFRDVAGVPAETIEGILDQARTLQDELSGSGESSLSLHRSRAAALLETTTTLLVIGDTQKALATAQQAQEILQTLRVQQPGSTDIQRELALAYEKVAIAQRKQGKLPAALNAYQADFAIISRLAKSDPSNAGWQYDLAGSYTNIGDVQLSRGNLSDAMTSYQASLDIIGRLAKSAPGNSDWQNGLAVSYAKVGEVEVAQDHLPTALTLYQASFTIRDHLAKSEPENTRWQRDLSNLNIDLGDVQMLQNNPTAALLSYQASLTIRDRLVKSDLRNTDWQSDLSQAYERIGDVQTAQHNASAAMGAYQASFAILEQLAKSNPGNAQWQRNLSVIYNKVGDAQGNNTKSALVSYQASFAIADRLAKSEPNNADWQHDLAMSYLKIATAYLKAKQLIKARDAFSACRDIMAALVAQFPDQSKWKQNLSVLDQEIAALKK